MAEVKLWNDKREREKLENCADLFAIIKTTEKLEKAYVRDAVSAPVYEQACSKLIAQFRTVKNLLSDINVERFMEAYKMDCPAAHTRLIVSGVPATVEHSTPSSSSNSIMATATAVADCTQNFITAMDSLKLEMVAADQLQPLLQDVLVSMGKVPQLPPDFEGKAKAVAWMSKLNSMNASDELNPEQARQLLFDLDSSYNAFKNALAV